ncbi:MAG: DUF4270 family protein [Williamsia sp.]|nr:DUF4270 family protein [Williamsia sp.]
MKKFYFGVAFLLAALILVQSCQKIDTTHIGIGLIPAGDNVPVYDTLLDVVTDTNFLYLDSSRITSTEDHALGYLEDPEFGNTSAAVYFGLSPLTTGSNPFPNKDSIGDRIDSVVLSLSYTGMYGDSFSVENIRVSEIASTADFKDSLTGYPVSAPYFPLVSQPLGTATVDFTKLNDAKQFKQGKDTALTTQENVLRIKLDRSLGLRLAAYDTTSAYSSDSLFATKFKGIALTIDSVASSRKKALAYFNLSDTAKTKLTVYYRTSSGGVLDTGYVNFIYNTSTSARNANLLRRTITGTNYQRNLASTTPNKDRLYIQSGPGSYATISVPGLSTMTNRLIYKAELIMKILPSQENAFLTPPILFLDQSDPVNSRYITVQNDFLIDNSGNYNYTTFGGLVKGDTGYIFNLTRYFQSVISRKQTVYKFRVSAPFQTQPYYASSDVYPPTYSLPTYPFLINSLIARGRVVLGGGSHSTQKMRVRLVYSRI